MGHHVAIRLTSLDFDDHLISAILDNVNPSTLSGILFPQLRTYVGNWYSISFHAPSQGFEPQPSAPDADILPLDHEGKCRF
jgi:hypothetical protein